MTDLVTQRHRQHVTQLVSQAFGDGRARIVSIEDINGGRGAFSVVLRADLQWSASEADSGDALGGARPKSVVAKLVADGPNGEAAIATGACGREVLAYAELLADSPIETPAVYAIDETADSGAAFLLEDLSDHRTVDQLDGLGVADAKRVAETLARFHHQWREDHRLAGLPVRRNTIAGLPSERLATGLAHLESEWSEELDAEARARFGELLANADRLIALFGRSAPTLCHGDPRADNLAFDDRDRVVLFDWQQIAVQFGEADLAWLAATSIEPAIRRSIDHELVSVYGGDFDRYRLGMALPGMAVLLLAQRDLPNERTRRFVATSLARIATAIGDLEVAQLR